MNKLKTIYLLIFFISIYLINGCAQVRESAGVNRKSPDEFQAIENPPLVIPPNYNLVSPDQLKEKDIENVEKDLAEEILFGLDEKNILEGKKLSTMNTIILQTEADQIDEFIRDEIDEDYAKEVSANDDFNYIWKNEIEVLDAVKESERIREKNFNNQSIEEGQVPIKKQKVKKKRKFFIF